MAGILWLALMPLEAAQSQTQSQAQAQPNHLQSETSPYLRQHAGDAIDWYPWGDEAHGRARRENKPIFLSIGYASCHWCHVQSRTTFTDKRVIAALNDHFITILVDREERPDLDHHFMEVMLAMDGRSGWPANFFLTPDGVPLFASGYLAAEPEYGGPGFVEIVHSLITEWDENREDILENAARIRTQLAEMAAPAATGTAQGSEDPREIATRIWSRKFDAEYGGFGDESKVLLPNVLSLLLHQGVRLRDRALLKNIYATLDHMAAGGVRDQLGGAFHRYSVDRFWQLPHFEIMLNENALLATLYLEAFQASGKPRYAAVARAILDDILARFRLPRSAGGGLAASLNAESDGEEGLYYTWTAQEIRTVLGAEKAETFLIAYLDPVHGAVKGRSVLRLLGQPQSLLAVEQDMKESRSHLLRARAKREPPSRDNKILTSWNALAISALAKAAQILGDEGEYLAVAREEMSRLLALSPDAHRLSHEPRKNPQTLDTPPGVVFLDDYAFLVQALLDLYEADFEVSHLNDAQRFMDALIRRFQDQPGTAFRFTPIGFSSSIPARTILHEGTVPSGNAAALIALNRLALFGPVGGEGKTFETQARIISQGLGRTFEDSAPALTGLLRAIEYSPIEAHEIVIVGLLEDPATGALLREVTKRLLHGTVLAVITPPNTEEEAPLENERWELLASRPLMDGKPTAYVCQQRLCEWPVNTPQALAAQLDVLVSKAPTP